MTEFFRYLKRNGTAELVAADLLFKRPTENLPGPSTFAKLDAADINVPNEITVVVTSCGRQNLLETTLDSFLKYNTFPIKEFIVIEDGDGSKNQFLAEKYHRSPFKWLATGQRVGQIAAIDMAYQAVRTEFIFHCEDDWEFFASGFIEKSLAILNRNHSILQVWIRALNDTNWHPVLNYTLTADEIPYRLLCHHHDTGNWGIWHGFSWNPGLRRRRDYRSLGGFGSLDPDTTKETWQVESNASAFYQQRGFFAAILTDNGGSGYVRHIGKDRRVPRDYLANRPVTSRCTGSSGKGSHIVDDLIFDVGAHRGEDTDYYLRRGFRVVGVEYDPEHVAFLRARFARELENGRFTLIDRAIAPQPGPVTFYRNKNVSVWRTAERSWADRNQAVGTEIEEITVDGITADVLFREYGIPFYLKIDIEGRDMLVVSALAQFVAKPSYLSLEAEDKSFDKLRAEFTALRALGYDSFKLSPQHHVHQQQVPPLSQHGKALDWTFEKGSSGLFGEDLAGPWISESEALNAYKPILLIYDVERAVRSGLLRGSFTEFLTKFGYESGWYDTHARHQSWAGGAAGFLPHQRSSVTEPAGREADLLGQITELTNSLGSARAQAAEHESHARQAVVESAAAN